MRITITVDFERPSDTSDTCGARDFDVTIEHDSLPGGSLSSEITLSPDPANGGRLTTWGGSLETWLATGPLLNWVANLPDGARRDVIASLTSGVGTETIEIES